MLECKDKEQAVLYIYRLYDLKPVNHQSLRPPAKEESMQTKGRKSSKKGRGKGKVKAEDVSEGVEEAEEGD